MTTITIQTIRSGPKRSLVITTEGRQYGFWTNKAEFLRLQEGATYNIVAKEWKEDDEGNMLYNITSAKLVTIGAQTTTREPFVSGTYRQKEPSSPPSPAAPDRGGFRSPEQITIAEIVCAYIAAGQCPPEKLKDIMTLARQAYNTNFGGPNADGTAFIHPSAPSRMNGNGAAH